MIPLMKQWHPVLAELLRPPVEACFEVQTTVPVSDRPLEVDFVLLRRTPRHAPLPSLWRHLTTWNTLEFKGPMISPRGEASLNPETSPAAGEQGCLEG
jgi:hypothetical protein